MLILQILQNICKDFLMHKYCMDLMHKIKTLKVNKDQGFACAV